MKNFLIDFLSLSFILTYVASVELDDCKHIVQVSKENQNTDSDVRRLQASIIYCQNQHRESLVKCQAHIQIKAWMNLKSDEQTFLIIDQVHDVEKHTNLQLINPYLIQVTTGEQTSTYPLVLNQVLDVTCPTRELVQRRTADNGDTLTREGGESKILFHLFSFRSN